MMCFKGRGISSIDNYVCSSAPLLFHSLGAAMNPFLIDTSVEIFLIENFDDPKTEWPSSEQIGGRTITDNFGLWIKDNLSLFCGSQTTYGWSVDLCVVDHR